MLVRSTLVYLQIHAHLYHPIYRSSISQTVECTLMFPASTYFAVESMRCTTSLIFVTTWSRVQTIMLPDSRGLSVATIVLNDSVPFFSSRVDSNSVQPWLTSPLLLLCRRAKISIKKVALTAIGCKVHRASDSMRAFDFESLQLDAAVSLGHSLSAH